MQSKYSAQQKRIMEHIGETLLCVQSVEALLSFSVQWIFPPVSIQTWNELLRANETKRKRMLRTMFHELKQCADIHPNFEECLDRFITNRNLFVHDRFNNSDYIINTSQNIERGHKFLEQLCADAWEIENILGGYFQIWSEKVGLTARIREKDPSFLENDDMESIRAGFKPWLFSKRWEGVAQWTKNQPVSQPRKSTL